jgi:prophage regulatory protein
MPTTQSEPIASLPDGQSAPLMRMPTVIRWTGLARSTIYRLIAEEKFPAPVVLAARAVAWRRTDLERWSEARPRSTH